MAVTALDLLLASRGAHYDWTWSRHLGEYEYRLLWWPRRSPAGLRGPQRRDRMRLKYFAGFVDRRRGRHWDCKRRST